MFDVTVVVNEDAGVSRQIETESQLSGYLEQIPDLVAITRASKITIIIKPIAVGEPTLPDFER